MASNLPPGVTDADIDRAAGDVRDQDKDQRVVKTTVTLVVFHPYYECLDDCTLEELGRYIAIGDGVGSSLKFDVDFVPMDKVEDELRAVGNDGLFFEDLFEDQPREGDAT